MNVVLYVFLFAISIILLVPQIGLSLAQQPANTVNLTKVISDDPELRLCSLCSSSVDVLYESPNTVALSSDYIDLIWKGVDDMKKYGYKIDDVVSYTTTSYTGRSSINTMVIMSK